LVASNGGAPKHPNWYLNLSRNHYERIRMRTKPIYGICGGYQMMFERIDDPYAIESELPDCEEALGWVQDIIVFEKEKKLSKGSYALFNDRVTGFEIRHGESQKKQLWFENHPIRGSFVHAVLENDSFRTRYFHSLNPSYIGYDFQSRKHQILEQFIEECRVKLDIERILNHVL
ncbi:MAG: nitroreductase/quinone reductase family protein, partial [Sulfuricurvum sp.]|nr:nitroreductase/quinone reductase family protein [Sulfuricurvum sp.]